MAKGAMIKVASSECAGRVVDRCVQVLGGRGYMREHPVERLYRDMRIERIWEGTSEIQRLILMNELDKRGLTNLFALPGLEGGSEMCAGAIEASRSDRDDGRTARHRPDHDIGGR
jgi:acyl-CoA dehydrogenase